MRSRVSTFKYMLQ